MFGQDVNKASWHLESILCSIYNINLNYITYMNRKECLLVRITMTQRCSERYNQRRVNKPATDDERVGRAQNYTSLHFVRRLPIKC